MSTTDRVRKTLQMVILAAIPMVLVVYCSYTHVVQLKGVPFPHVAQPKGVPFPAELKGQWQVIKAVNSNGIGTFTDEALRAAVGKIEVLDGPVWRMTFAHPSKWPFTAAGFSYSKILASEIDGFKPGWHEMILYKLSDFELKPNEKVIVITETDVDPHQLPWEFYMLKNGEMIMDWDTARFLFKRVSTSATTRKGS